jgi:broad specificity phosphatase PhoE
MPGPIIYYVRHGLTDWNAAGRLQGRHDTPLNAEGRVQAARCGGILTDLFARERCKPQAYDFVSSPLLRARDTMEVVRATLGLDPAGYCIEPRLAEISFGDWEGLTYEDVLARDPDIVARREGHKWTFLPPGGESYAQVAERVGAWYATVKRDTVVTAHGGTARALAALTGVVPCEEAAHVSIEQGAVYAFADGQLARYA